jgi:hypothetical protein
MDVPGILVLIGGAVLAGTILGFRQRGTDLRAKDQLLRKERDALKLERDEHQTTTAALRDANDTINRKLQSIKELNRLFDEKSKAMPWLAELIADLHWVQDERDAQRLKSKKRPAHAAAELVRSHAQEKKQLRIEKRLVDYRLALIDSLFPWLRDIGFQDAEQIAQAKAREAGDSDEDPVAKFLSPDEWSKLPVTERNQRALDRYKMRAKSDWEIGREFERFIGHKFDSEGYDVVYHGAIKGYDDFGRDLIITERSGRVLLVQCKYWSQHKVIPEAAVFQLLGSTISYYIEQTGHAPPDLKTLYQCIQPCLFSSTKVAPQIREIAKTMGIKVEDTLEMRDWPMVKCNIATDGGRIYHLPMDQQYDRVKLAKQGECYCWTVADAEAKGFRRAKRWVQKS